MLFMYAMYHYNYDDDDYYYYSTKEVVVRAKFTVATAKPITRMQLVQRKSKHILHTM